jgi:general secretion pathway protein G
MIEILVVMVILGLLAALVAPNFFGQAEKARVKAARLQIANLGTALDAMALDTGRYPSAQEGLEALLDPPGGMEMWDGPYLKKLPKDPWNHEYVYRGGSGNSQYEILSYGADGSPGGDGGSADISSLD